MNDKLFFISFSGIYATFCISVVAQMVNSHTVFYISAIAEFVFISTLLVSFVHEGSSDKKEPDEEPVNEEPECSQN
jgi:hypothetical protein